MVVYLKVFGNVRGDGDDSEGLFVLQEVSHLGAGVRDPKFVEHTLAQELLPSLLREDGVHTKSSHSSGSVGHESITTSDHSTASLNQVVDNHDVLVLGITIADRHDSFVVRRAHFTAHNHVEISVEKLAKSELDEVSKDSFCILGCTNLLAAPSSGKATANVPGWLSFNFKSSDLKIGMVETSLAIAPSWK